MLQIEHICIIIYLIEIVNSNAKKFKKINPKITFGFIAQYSAFLFAISFLKRNLNTVLISGCMKNNCVKNANGKL